MQEKEHRMCARSMPFCRRDLSTLMLWSPGEIPDLLPVDSRVIAINLSLALRSCRSSLTQLMFQEAHLFLLPFLRNMKEKKKVNSEMLSSILHCSSRTLSFNDLLAILKLCLSGLKNIASLSLETQRNFALCPKYLSFPEQFPLL